MSLQNAEKRVIEIPTLIYVSKPTYIKKQDGEEPVQEERLFKMIVSPELIDLQNDFIQIEAIYKVLDIWMERDAPLMDTHTNVPCGKGLSWKPVEYQGYRAALVEGKIWPHYSNDEEVWVGMQNGDYTQNSIGGRMKAFARKCDSNQCYNYITDLELYEISIVPKGANQLADNFVKEFKDPNNLDRFENAIKTFQYALQKLILLDKNFQVDIKMSQENPPPETDKPEDKPVDKPEDTKESCPCGGDPNFQGEHMKGCEYANKADPAPDEEKPVPESKPEDTSEEPAKDPVTEGKEVPIPDNTVGVDSANMPLETAPSTEIAGQAETMPEEDRNNPPVQDNFQPQNIAPMMLSETGSPAVTETINVKKESPGSTGWTTSKDQALENMRAIEKLHFEKTKGGQTAPISDPVVIPSNTVADTIPNTITAVADAAIPTDGTAMPNTQPQTIIKTEKCNCSEKMAIQDKKLEELTKTINNMNASLQKMLSNTDAPKKNCPDPAKQAAVVVSNPVVQKSAPVPCPLANNEHRLGTFRPFVQKTNTTPVNYPANPQEQPDSVNITNTSSSSKLPLDVMQEIYRLPPEKRIKALETARSYYG